MTKPYYYIIENWKHFSIFTKVYFVLFILDFMPRISDIVFKVKLLVLQKLDIMESLSVVLYICLIVFIFYGLIYIMKYDVKNSGNKRN